MFTPTNTEYNTRPVFEALVSGTSYVGVWVCSNPEDGDFYEVDYNFVGYYHPEDRDKQFPPRRVIKDAGWFEDGLIRADKRKPSVFVRTYAEAMALVTQDIAEHQLHQQRI